MLTLRGATPRETAARQPLGADIDGFSLHTAVRVEAHDRKRLKQLCCHITRPALSDQRVQLDAAGQVELKLKTQWRDGTTHLVMSPLEFMPPLAALMPWLRLHLIRFHGVLAPNAKLRPLVVPQGPEVQARTTEVAAASEGETETVQLRPHRINWARLSPPEPRWPLRTPGTESATWRQPGWRCPARGLEAGRPGANPDIGAERV